MTQCAHPREVFILAEPIVDIRELTKVVEGIAVVEGVTFAVEPGETFGLLGPVGSAKSLVLKLLATIVPVSSGKARIAGRDLLTEPEAIRPLIGYMPDFLGVYNDMRVGELLEFFGKAYALDDEDLARRRDRLLQLAALEPRRGVYVETLSTEEKQRLGLIKTLLHRPRVLMLDEPGTALDPPARRRLHELVAALHDEVEATIVSSNILSDLLTLCDRIAVMHRGRVLLRGRPDELTTLASAQFIELDVAELEPAVERLRAHARVQRVIAEAEHLLIAPAELTADVPAFVETLRADGIDVRRYREHELDPELLQAEA